MITADTGRKIWSTYKEIENATELMAAAVERMKQETENQGLSSRDEPQFKYTPVEMSIPHFHRKGNDTGSRIYQLTAELAVRVLEDHIENMHERLDKLMIIAKHELGIETKIA